MVEVFLRESSVLEWKLKFGQAMSGRIARVIGGVRQFAVELFRFWLKTMIYSTQYQADSLGLVCLSIQASPVMIGW